MRLIVFLVVFVSLLSCSTPPIFRGPASHSLIPFESELERLENSLYIGFESTKDCERIIGDHFQNIRNQQYDSRDIDEFSDERITDFIHRTFKLKQGIRKRLSELKSDYSHFDGCMKQVNHIMISLRYMEDFLVNAYYKREGKKASKVNLSGSFPQLITDGKVDFHSYHDLQNGDILLTRAKTFMSAAIARIGRNDTQFSHLSMVYKDKNGKLYTVESLVEKGLIIKPIKVHLKRKHVRTLVFRHPDKDLRERAANFIYQEAKRRTKNKGLTYDFSMDYKNHDHYFCSEVIYHAYEHASGGKMDMPIFKTEVNPGIVPFLKTLGVSVDANKLEEFNLFAPADLLTDHRFDLVVEWRNPELATDLLIKDTILTQIFYWMEQKGYRLVPDSKTKRLAKLGRAIRKTPILALFVSKYYPRDMKLDMMQSFLVLNSVATKLEKHIHKIQEGHKRQLLFPEVFDLLDQYRKEDFKRWENGEKSDFHKTFHPI